MSTQPSSIRAAYQHLQDCLRMQAASENPDHKQLAMLHCALAAYEFQLNDELPEQCLANLKERFRLAAMIDLPLFYPLWATQVAEALAEERPA